MSATAVSADGSTDSVRAVVAVEGTCTIVSRPKPVPTGNQVGVSQSSQPSLQDPWQILSTFVLLGPSSRALLGCEPRGHPSAQVSAALPVMCCDRLGAVTLLRDCDAFFHMRNDVFFVMCEVICALLLSWAAGRPWLHGLNRHPTVFSHFPQGIVPYSSRRK